MYALGIWVSGICAQVVVVVVVVGNVDACVEKCHCSEEWPYSA